MRYRVTCLTPTLVGDGQKLAPVDYMVWKDQVNVLDQRRIFKLLAKGPRLEGYLTQIRKAERLDFAEWGGFAQNFPLRRIPFEHPSLTAVWERQRADALFVPTFASGPAGPYLPASAIRGAIHSALLFSRWTDGLWKQLADRFEGERIPRRPAEPAEDQALGLEGYSRMRSFGIGDSAPVSNSSFKVYLVRVASLVARGQGRLELGWKTPMRSTVEGRRIEEGGAHFCEMAIPGTEFEGAWFERKFLANSDWLRQLRWKGPLDVKTVLDAANSYSARILTAHKQYAQNAGLKTVEHTVGQLEQRLAEIQGSATDCLIPLGWGGGLLTKAGNPATEDESYRKLLRLLPYYNRAIQTGLPFPKTRRVVFLGGYPATLPGWVQLEVGG